MHELPQSHTTLLQVLQAVRRAAFWPEVLPDPEEILRHRLGMLPHRLRASFVHDSCEMAFRVRAAYNRLSAALFLVRCGLPRGHVQPGEDERWTPPHPDQHRPASIHPKTP
jgi:hypothetical protein